MNRTVKVWSPVLLFLAVCVMSLGPCASVGTPAQPGSSDREVSDVPPPRVDRLGDPLPQGAIHRFGTARFRSGWVGWGGVIEFPLAVSPDGKTIAILSYEGLRLFDLSSGKQLVWSAHPPEMYLGESPSLDFSPDGKSVALLVHSGECLIWDAGTGRQFRRLHGIQKRVKELPWPLGDHPGVSTPIKGLGFTENGKSLLACVDGKKVWVLDPLKDRVSREVDLEMGPVVSVSKDRKRLLAGNVASQLQVVDVPTRKVTAILKVPPDTKEEGSRVRLAAQGQGGPKGAVLSPSGRRIAILTGHTIWTFDSTGKPLHTLRGQASSKELDSRLLAITHDDRVLLAGTTTGKILRWDLSNGKALPPIGRDGLSDEGVYPHPNGKSIITLGYRGIICLWDMDTGRQMPTVHGYEDIGQAVFTADGCHAIVRDRRRDRIDVWDVETGRLHHSVNTHDRSARTLGFDADQKIGVSWTEDGWISIRELSTWKEKYSIQLKTEGRPPKPIHIRRVAITPNGRRVFVAADDWGAGLFDATTRKELWRREDSYRLWKFSPDGSMYFATNSRGLSCIDTETGKLKWTCSYSRDEQREYDVGGIDVSVDGRQVAVHLYDTIRLIDAGTGQQTRSLGKETNTLHGAPYWRRRFNEMFSRDGKWLLLPGEDGGVGMVEIASGLELFRFKGHFDCWRTQFHPDGKRALTVQVNETVLFWDLRPAHVPVAKDAPERIWQDLASQDGPTVYRATWSLIDDPGTAVELLKRKLSPAPPALSRDSVVKFITQLNDDDFATREQASKVLVGQGKWILPLLEEALKRSRLPEQRRRLSEVIERVTSEPDEWHILRAVQALELGGSVEGKSLLRSWTSGRKGALLTEQGRQAVARMSK